MSMSAEGIAILIATFAGIVGSPLYDVIKKALGLTDNVALAGFTVFSLVLGAVVSYAGGAFTGLSFTLAGVIQAAAIVFAAATILFKALVKGKKPSDPDDEFPPAG